MLIVVTDVMTTLAEVIFRVIRDSDMTLPEALLTTSTAVVETLVTTTDISFFPGLLSPGPSDHTINS